MSKSTSRQRKMIYGIAIAVLMIPIIILGAPGAARNGGGGALQEGGKLARMRTEAKLGESTLGDVDPASSSMTFVLLGFRGLAANQLWLLADKQKSQKKWPELKATVDSIVKLQPHFKRVWEHQGWNLAYNVSAEWDAVPDRYYWVKEGGKFLMEGTRRTERYPELYWEVGRVLGAKIGRSDEWRYFRKYFKDDPLLAGGGQDPEFAEVDGRQFYDNYLAAKHWFEKANVADESVQQRMMDDALFRGHPARAQFDFAGALHREGQFDEESRQAWEDAYGDWTVAYGSDEIFNSLFGGRVTMEADDARLLELAEEDVREFTLQQKRLGQDGYRKIANYQYWKDKAAAERQKLTETAHRLLYEGRRLYHEDNNTPSNLFRPTDPELCEKLADLDLSDPQRALLDKFCEERAELVWDVDPDAPGLSEEARDKLARVRTSLAEGVKLVLVRDLAAELGSTRDEVVDTLLELVDTERIEVISEAQAVLERGMAKYERVVEENQVIQDDTIAMEEAVMAVLYFNKLHEISGRIPPREHPLRKYWDTEYGKEGHGLIGEVERQFRRHESQLNDSY